MSPQRCCNAHSSPPLVCISPGNCPVTSEAQNQLLTAIINALDDAILSKTLDGIITSWNLAAERMFGYTVENIIGKSNTVLFPPDRLDEEEMILDRLKHGLATDHLETVRLHKNGTALDISVTISPIKDGQGQVIGACTIARDITERNRITDALRESEQRLQTALSAGNMGIWELDLLPNRVRCSEQTALLLGLEANVREVSWADFELLVYPQDRAGIQQTIDTLVTLGTSYEHTFRIVRPDGEVRWLQTNGRTQYDDKDRPVCLKGTVMDITERKLAEQKQKEDAERLRISEERYALAVEGSQNGLWDWHIPTGQIHVSALWEQMLGYAEGEVPTRIEDLVVPLHPDDQLRVEATLAAYLNRETDIYEAEYRMRHKDGSYRWILSRGVAQFDAEGKPQRMAGSHMDITERKQFADYLQTAIAWQNGAIEQLLLLQVELLEANERLEALATRDVLTGVKNHRGLQERLREEYDGALRYNTPLSVLMLDVDKFKQYNDTFGHPAGDTVLRQVARILQETGRASDVVTRYGGEEFAVLLPGADVEESKTVAERFRKAIETASWPERAVTVSIGATTLTPTTLHPDALLANADMALYRSKHRGRNCVTHATDPLEIAALDTEAVRWYDGLLQKPFAIQSKTQSEASGAAAEQVRDTLVHACDATILSWSRILDLKDKETEGHSERVTKWMVRLMKHLDFDEQEVRFARWGAWLHDIGKIAIPDSILHKPGTLTDEEWVIMRQHTTIAYDMLQSIEFLGPALEIPYCHHEKWDGSGYPRGLKGEEIPLLARLFAVIDVYDALMSDRPYRKAWSEERVQEYLQEQAGTHFDPRAVTAFVNLLEAERAQGKDASPTR